MTRIAIYSDQKAQTSTYEIQHTLEKSFPTDNVECLETSDFLNALENNTADILVLPGIASEDSAYYDMLGKENGQKKLKYFVERGGLLITICAGSYFVAEETIYEPTWSHQRSRTNIHPLFNALAYGPISSISSAATPHTPDHYVIPVRYTNKQGAHIIAHSAYSNGPALYPFAEDQNIEVLARYDFEDKYGHNPIAAAFSKQGKGAILWMGILPYMAHHPDMDANNLPDDEQKFISDLKTYDNERKLLWDRFILRVKNHLDEPTKNIAPKPPKI